MTSETPELGDGGWSTEAYAGGEVVCVCIGAQADIQKAVGTNFPVFIPISFRCQVVAGTNYLVKVAVDLDKCVHAMIFQDLRGNLIVPGVQYPKTMTDPLVPFLNTV